MKKIIGITCLLGSIAAADVADLEQMQSTNVNVVYQYTFEGGDPAQFEQKVGTFAPGLEVYSNAEHVVTFPDGYDSSTKVGHTTAGSLWSFDLSRHAGSGLRTAADITYSTNGTIEYIVRCSDINDNGYVIAGTGTGLSSRLRFFHNDGTDTVSRAQMTIGSNSQVDLIGGDTEVDYNAGDWYYVAQTWTFTDATHMKMNAWVANLSSGTPVLTQTVSSESRYFVGGLDTPLYLGSMSEGSTNSSGRYSNSDLDALAIYDAQLSESTILANFRTVVPRPQGAVRDLEEAQAAEAGIAYQYTFEGGEPDALNQKVNPYEPDLEQVLLEPNRKADFPTAGYDSSTRYADFLAWASGSKGDGLRSETDIAFAAAGTIEYLVQFGAMSDNHFVLKGSGTGADARMYFCNVNGAVPKALMVMGPNVGYDLIGGTSGVAYTNDVWYYVAQTWSISGGTVTMNAWVSDLSDVIPTLVKTIDGASNSYDGDTTSKLDLANAGGSNFADCGLDALAIYDAQLDVSTIQSHFSVFTDFSPATIVGLSPFSANVLRMVVDAPDAGVNYYPKSKTDLVIGTWAGVGHSTNGAPPFVTTNLDYVTEYDATGTNEVIYVQATNAAGFFGIGDQ